MKNIVNVIDRLRSESIEKLQDPSYLEYKLLPELGLNDRHLQQYPSFLHPYCGTGIDSWQYPNQFSRYLHFLSQQKIQSYVEIGCHKGGTFIITVEYLARFNPVLQAVAVDNWPREIMHEYKKYVPNIEYITESSQSSRFRELYLNQDSWDLVLIDGDHSYNGARADYELVKDRAKNIAFHDIKNSLCPGTQQIWADIKHLHSSDCLHEWTDQYDEVLLRMRGSIMGIGLVQAQ
jgi:SAM-dependent methyltransferase